MVVESERTLRVHMLQLHHIGFDDCIKVQVIKENAAVVSTTTSSPNQASLVNNVAKGVSSNVTVINETITS